MSLPRDFTVNGLGRIGITIRNQDGLEPLQENSLEFTGLAFAIHAGLSILEKPEGRQALQRVGLIVVQEWARAQRFGFGGDPNLMPRYVDEPIFLRMSYSLKRLQAGIPYILDSEGLARKIQPACILQLVTRVNEFRTFPFETTGRPMTYQQRRTKGLLSLGSTEATGQQVGSTFMRPRRERPQPLYNIPVSELSRVPLEPRRALRVRQVA
ncbi:hypothetical protein BFJ63_vAg5821 [Fusarium oxysporum f. sp. narcissi]|uniref:Uncharacterized protein n=1 Tax=Fusarium oxysporum f. sp. narcissi TaxID=451672 RepID=A0A4Q2VWQ8_FUSOX|nr:hypothetical protein BFJ63_vAg5821 [Fusarium oxysporum f. sp. narcissi]